MIVDWIFFISFLITLLCFAVFLFYLIPKQFKEVLLPYSWLTKLRWYILAILILIVITLIPGLIYQFFLAIGTDYPVLRKVSSIIGRINLLGLTALFVLIYTYRKED